MIQHFCARKMMIIIIILARALRMSKRMIFHVMHEPIINNSKFQVQELPPIVDAIFNDIMMMGYRLASQCGSITNMRMVLLDFYSSAAIFFFLTLASFFVSAVLSFYSLKCDGLSIGQLANLLNSNKLTKKKTRPSALLYRLTSTASSSIFFQNLCIN